MANDRKRSFTEYLEDSEPTFPNNSIAETLSRIQNGDETSNLASDKEDWQMAKGSRSKKQKKKKQKNKRKSTSQDLSDAEAIPDDNVAKRDTKPGLDFLPHRLNSIIKIVNLQELILYCLADGVAPHWIAVRNHSQICKAVVLFVPGLEQAMFTGKIELGSGSRLGAPELDDTTVTQKKDSLLAVRELANNQRNPDDYLPVPLVADNLPVALKPLATIFPDMWPVKAPGDDKQHRVHSPLHAILTSPVPRAAGEKKGRGQGVKPPRVAKDWKDEPTPITYFISSADELRENQYVLHPCQASNSDEEYGNAAQRKDPRGSPEDGWRNTSVQSLDDGSVPNEQTLIAQGTLTAGRTLLALDCEMCVVGEDEYALTRVSIVGWDGKVVLDELVKPDKPITNYLTQ